METSMAGMAVVANDGREWWCGDLGWYPLPLDSESWPSEHVPTGIARVLHDPHDRSAP